MGSIGRKVAALMKAFGAEVIYYDPFRLDSKTEMKLGITYVDTDGLLAKSDILTLHAPLTEQTQNFICEQSLAKMKDGSVLINTAREGLVDYNAAARALHEGKLLGAGFDAIEEDNIQRDAFRLYTDGGGGRDPGDGRRGRRLRKCRQYLSHGARI